MGAGPALGAPVRASSQLASTGKSFGQCCQVRRGKVVVCETNARREQQNDRVEPLGGSGWAPCSVLHGRVVP